MSEALKTLVAVGVAGVVAVVAYFSRPSDVEFTDATIREQVNKPLFPDFKDPGAAARLEIVKFASDVGDLSRFEVARDKQTDLWTIPSHSGYPADAENQMRDVSVMFIDLPILGVASSVADEHALFGVLEPDEKASASGGGDGVGMLVKMENRDGEDLVNLIVGKPVKGVEGQRFVRKPGQDVVYVVQLNPDKLSTKFEEWIQKDLLELNAWDINSVKLLDYSVIGSLQQGSFAIDQRLEVDLGWDSAKGEWKLDRLLTFRGREAIPATLAESEELNTAKLNDLKTALDDLTIVDVFRKPKGMGADLRADQEFTKDLESVQSLVDKGFYPLAMGEEGAAELKSANGEVHVAMKDGIAYILRFGDTASTSGPGDKLNRFLFVTARFDESKVPLPEKPAELQTPAASPAPAAPPAESGPPAETTPPAEPAAAAEPAPAGDADPAAAPATPPPGACGQETPPADSAAGQSPSANPPVPPAADAPPQGGTETEEQAAAREKLEKEFQRKVDERNEKVEKGKQRVRELNGRFADWYYVISEDLYRKVHLSRVDIIKPKGAGAEQGEGIQDFRKLEQEGLRKSETP